tara:strand:- start:742 stop:1944 length:1203 start_codon:yes stop_codon:yes gene_type:complete
MKKYLTFLLDFILLPAKYFIRLVFSLIPRNKNIWVFSSWNGMTFSDNSKYFYLYVLKSHPEIQVSWITKSKKVYSELTEANLPVCYFYSWQGLVACVRASAQFTTHGLYDISPMLTKNSKHFALFHASFPIKKMENDAFDRGISSKFIQQVRKPFVLESPFLSVSSSINTQRVICSALRMDASAVPVFGYPRSNFMDRSMDLMTDSSRISNIADLSEYDNVIYYVPTFRQNDRFDPFEYSFDSVRLGTLLEATNSIFIIRFHPFDLKRMLRRGRNLGSRVILENHDIDDPYPLLRRTDVLITDYSSIFADFLLLDRPMIFANFDYLSYVAEERSLYWDYEKVTPGAKVSDWPSLLEQLKSILLEDNDQYTDFRKRMTRFIYQKSALKPSEALFHHVQRTI